MNGSDIPQLPDKYPLYEGELVCLFVRSNGSHVLSLQRKWHPIDFELSNSKLTLLS